MRKKIYVFVLVTFFISIGLTTQQRIDHSRLLKAAFQGPWITLNPSLQHTVWGDLLLSNQFDPLVGIDSHGVLSPLGAKSWTVSEDFKVFRFQIDSSLRFSDGSPLTASDYKRSWLRSFELEPKSANSSLHDVLYRIEGFKEDSQTPTLDGVIADGDRLEVRFSQPFRMALEYLSGVRFAAFKENSEGFLGTGRFTLSPDGVDRVHLSPNTFRLGHEALSEVVVSVLPPKATIGAFKAGEMDVMAYGIADAFAAELPQVPEVELIAGQEAAHYVYGLNGTTQGRIFEKEAHRRAAQFIIFDFAKRNPELFGNPRFTRLDPQIYLAGQSGRLEDEEAIRRVESGRSFVPALKKASAKNPVVTVTNQTRAWVRRALEEAGITVSEKSRIAEVREITALTYKGGDYDLIAMGFSVVSGDPDGIYHALGKSGAILNPLTLRPRVAELLEEGRSILGQEKLDGHYRKVSEAVLREVPFVHLGFGRAVAVIRKDRVKLGDRSLRRNEGHLDFFQLR